MFKRDYAFFSGMYYQSMDRRLGRTNTIRISLVVTRGNTGILTLVWVATFQLPLCSLPWRPLGLQLSLLSTVQYWVRQRPVAGEGEGFSEMSGHKGKSWKPGVIVRVTSDLILVLLLDGHGAFGGSPNDLNFPKYKMGKEYLMPRVVMRRKHGIRRCLQDAEC